MPELQDGAVVFGCIAALVGWLARRRLPFILIPLIALVAAYIGPPSFAVTQTWWRGVGLPDITGGMAFVGALIGFFAAVMREEKGQPRRTPIWVAALIGVGAAFVIPFLADTLTGRYQSLSLRANVNHCTEGMRGEVQPRLVTNICAEPITVGLCLSDEMNPEPCRQTATLAPNESARFEPEDQALSSSGNRNGLTVVACRPPHRPSRWMNSTGKSYEGVCLPPN